MIGLNIFKHALFFLMVGVFFQNVCAQNAWDYTGNRGPRYWGNLNPKYRLCAMGQQQSPISIGRSTLPLPEKICFNYQTVSLDLVRKFNNLYIYMRHPKKDYVTFREEKYFLRQMHFHTPSEHALHNKRYAMEAHLVHKNKQGKLLVVGVWIKPGRSNPILHQLFNVSLPELGHEKMFTTVHVNPGQFLPKNSAYYSYCGSLTTPPCSENVTWILFKKPMTASPHEIQSFKRKVRPFNARPLQPLNARPIYHSVH